MEWGGGLRPWTDGTCYAVDGEGGVVDFLLSNMAEEQQRVVEAGIALYLITVFENTAAEAGPVELGGVAVEGCLTVLVDGEDRYLIVGVVAIVGEIIVVLDVLTAVDGPVVHTVVVGGQKDALATRSGDVDALHAVELAPFEFAIP